MKFSMKKLASSEASQMRRVPLRLLQPYSLMATPVYALLEKNQKLVAIKGPMSFFQPHELDKYKVLGDLYLPKFIDRVKPFQEAGEGIRRLLTLREKAVVRSTQGEKEALIPISTHELGDAVLSALAPLWGPSGRIEPFFTVFLADEVCGQLSSENLAQAHDLSVEGSELAILRASLAVFVALHVGIYDAGALKRLRDEVFAKSLASVNPGSEVGVGDSQWVRALVFRLLPELAWLELDERSFNGTDPASAKVRSRLKRLKRDFLGSNQVEFTIFGKEGISDA